MRPPIPWTSEGEEHVYRRDGKLVARVNWTGFFWRGTVFNTWGSSSATGYSFTEALAFCEDNAA